MVDVRTESKPAFLAAGKKTWISGQDNEIFGRFWQEAHESGLVDRLKTISSKRDCKVTQSDVFGVSCVEDDPNNRAFDFFIATEVTDESEVITADCSEPLELHSIPACRWAIFSNKGKLPMSLVDAEMFAFMEWLPKSGYRHANAPELEVYPADDPSAVEFWLPIVEDR